MVVKRTAMDNNCGSFFTMLSTSTILRIHFAFSWMFMKIFPHFALKYVINIHIQSGYNSDEIEFLSLLFHHSLHGYSIASSGMKFHRKWPSTQPSKMKSYIMLYDFQGQTLSKL